MEYNIFMQLKEKVMLLQIIYFFKDCFTVINTYSQWLPKVIVK